MRGRIDIVRPEGVVEGWCWDEQSPGKRIEVSVLVDGVDSGSALAGLYREDLDQAKIGDGFHHFSLILSEYSVQRPTQTLTLVDTCTRAPIGEPFIFRNTKALSFDSRLIELEAKNRLLETRLAELAQLQSSAAHAELFSVIGTFFAKLAEDAERGLPPSLDLQLSGLLQAKTRAHPLLDFGRSINPVFTIVLNADCEMSQLYNSLASLHSAGAGSVATIILLDTGRFDDVALISSVVRGVTYIRAVADLVSELTLVETSTESEFILIMSGQALVADTLLKELQECAATYKHAGAIGACITDDDGHVLNGGLYLEKGELIEHVGVGQQVTHHANALLRHAVAIRRVAFRNVGGFSPMFGNDLGSALIDLCFRLQQNAWNVVIQPFANLRLQTSRTGEIYSSILNDRSRFSDFLRQSWFGQDFPVQSRCAIVVETDNSLIADLQVVQRLSDAAYSVTYLARDDQVGGAKARLQRAGATIAFDSAPEDPLLNQAADIAYASDGRLPSFLNKPLTQIFSNLADVESFLATQCPSVNIA